MLCSPVRSRTTASIAIPVGSACTTKEILIRSVQSTELYRMFVRVLRSKQVANGSEQTQHDDAQPDWTYCIYQDGCKCIYMDHMF